ncbi:MAG: dihydrolipoyl dehydrogenase [Candidatus Woesearchaeota archaeon]|jgi:dihydrolipoamide dehydrogenase|nr:dihydrolipoyl dehydrogenase [Candidatus Woesearchaeota archaeon]MDP7623063.1 dihydrolipoyl dehydrogenase [Candidatus Woesearchaeota archaeon]HJN56333.1 dihydrolipoyl dehydrogenase [Candidatus Woesearchaeota archaeon]|tara:strand:+ start:26427 stop:27827 length:1401 start_codon:yes stop_codon:yes gene_type:complete
MSPDIKTEIAVIGAGPGGYVAAIRAAQLGKEVVLIEQDKLGGICLNYGCIPSKAMIYAADFFDKIKKSSKFGISADNVKMDFKKLQEWKSGILSKLAKGIESLCKGNKVTIIKGNASFENSSRIKITSEKNTSYIDFEKAIIATGSKPIELKTLKFDKKKIISSKDALSLEKIPKNMVIIGGGYIGLELGTVYSKLGSNVSIVEMQGQILPGSEKPIISLIEKNFSKRGVKIYLNAKAEKIEDVKIIINSKEKGIVKLDADKVMVAVGRVPNTKNLGIKNTKVRLDEKGFVRVDKNLLTSDKNIYAIGDVSDGPMLAHKASMQAKLVAEIIAGHNQEYENFIVPSVIFTDPEIASVGITEQEAKEKGIKTKIGKFPFLASSRSMTRDEIQGFVKMIANEKDNKILGVQIAGSEASDIISEAALAIKMGATLDDVALTIHPHPTLSESLMEAAEATLGKAIHIFNLK